MSKKKQVIIGTILLLLAGGLYVWFFQYNKPHINVSEEKADFIITAEELITEFEKDPVSSDKKYKNKILEIRADKIEITEVKDTGQEGYVINVSLPNKSYTIDARLAEKPAKEVPGNVTFRGVYSGYLEPDEDMEIQGSIQLMRGVVVKNN